MESLIQVATALQALHHDSVRFPGLRAAVPLALSDAVPLEWQPHLQDCLRNSPEACRCLVFERPDLTGDWSYVGETSC